MGGAGALMGLGVHLIDLVRHLVGQEVIGVSAVASWATAESPLESFAQVLLEFPGAQTHLVYGGSLPLSRNDVVLYGGSGRLTLDGVVDVLSGGALEVALPDGAGGQRLERWAPACGVRANCSWPVRSASSSACVRTDCSCCHRRTPPAAGGMTRAPRPPAC